MYECEVFSSDGTMAIKKDGLDVVHVRRLVADDYDAELVAPEAMATDAEYQEILDKIAEALR